MGNSSFGMNQEEGLSTTIKRGRNQKSEFYIWKSNQTGSSLLYGLTPAEKARVPFESLMFVAKIVVNTTSLYLFALPSVFREFGIGLTFLILFGFDLFSLISTYYLIWILMDHLSKSPGAPHQDVMTYFSIMKNAIGKKAAMFLSFLLLMVLLANLIGYFYVISLHVEDVIDFAIRRIGPNHTLLACYGRIASICITLVIGLVCCLIEILLFMGCIEPVYSNMPDKRGILRKLLKLLISGGGFLVLGVLIFGAEFLQQRKSLHTYIDSFSAWNIFALPSYHVLGPPMDLLRKVSFLPLFFLNQHVLIEFIWEFHYFDEFWIYSSSNPDPNLVRKSATFRLAMLAHFLVFIIYALIGISGYWVFDNLTLDNIIENMNPTPVLMVSRSLFMLVLVFSCLPASVKALGKLSGQIYGILFPSSAQYKSSGKRSFASFSKIIAYPTGAVVGLFVPKLNTFYQLVGTSFAPWVMCLIPTACFFSL